ncbi:MAG: hypothetical protein GXO91_05400 [FCB group bacterium]|nr:hypothetical protein [FCB group bacterium]
MKNKKIRVVLVTVFLLVISALVLNFVGDTGLLKGSTRSGLGKLDVNQVTVKKIEKEVKTDETALVDYIRFIDKKTSEINIAKMRDPFMTKSEPKEIVQVKKPKVIPKKKRPKIRIGGIVWDKLNPYAIINGDIYEIGDKLDDYTVHTILDSMIILSNDNDIFTVQFTQE